VPDLEPGLLGFGYGAHGGSPSRARRAASELERAAAAPESPVHIRPMPFYSKVYQLTYPSGRTELATAKHVSATHTGFVSVTSRAFIPNALVSRRHGSHVGRVFSHAGRTAWRGVTEHPILLGFGLGALGAVALSFTGASIAGGLVTVGSVLSPADSWFRRFSYGYGLGTLTAATRRGYKWFQQTRDYLRVSPNARRAIHALNWAADRIPTTGLGVLRYQVDIAATGIGGARLLGFLP